MENLQQVVVQLTTAPYERSLAQYGEGFMPEKQTEIIYSELDEQDKAVWDAFVAMIKSKN
jgi:hypothetical protein